MGNFFQSVASSRPVVVNRLLDDHSGASAAYSLRLLSSTYTGDAVEVYNGSSYADIGFSGGELDTTALATHCGSNDGFVSVWYDQSGNANDATQSSPTNMPKIYDGTTGVVTENGKPAVYFSSDILVMGSEVAVESAFITSDATSSGAVGALIGNSTKTYSFGPLLTGGYRYRTNSNYDQASLTNYGYFLSSFTINSSLALNVYQNGTIATESPQTVNDTLDTSQLMYRHDDYGVTGHLYEVVLYASDQSDNRTSIESNIGDYFTQNTPLLDAYPGAAAAYSLRLLDSTYTGDAIEVYNGSSYADIGFNVFGELDTAALAAHCGSNDGFVSKWYDQSGNANAATQTTPANMPKIYDGTTGVQTENGKPIINLREGNSCTLLLSTTLTNSTTHVFGVAELDLTDNKVMIGILNGAGFYIANNNDTSSAGIGQSLYINGASSSLTTRDEISDQFQNQTSFNSILNLSSADQTRFGMLNISGDNYKMFNMQEIIFYESAQSSNRPGIEDNINTFYSIY